MHAWFLYSCHMDHGSYYMSYSCIPITWLFPVTVIDILITGYMSRWYAMCGILHLLFPVSRFPLSCFVLSTRAHVMLSCYMYHILYLFLIYCIAKDNKENLGMGETWRLTRSSRVDVWINCCPTAGDGVVLATVWYSSWAPISRYYFSSLSSRYMLQP